MFGRRKKRKDARVVIVCVEHGRITTPIRFEEIPGCIDRHRQAGCKAALDIRTATDE